MLDGIKQYLYLVVDRETNLILTRCRNAATANAVSRGFLNSTVMVINRPDFFQDDRMRSYGTTNQISFKLTISNFSGISSLESNVGEKLYNKNHYFDFIEYQTENQEWKEKRQLANTRSKIFSIIESKIERYLARYISFVAETMVYQHLSNEFQNYDDTNCTYSDTIIEYSKIVSLTPKEAFDDLKMKYDSYCLTTIRYFAIWEKSILTINSLAEFTDKIYADIEAELAGMNRQ